MEEENESQGTVDLVSVLYIVGGVPAIVGFIVLLFTLVNYFPSIPA
ncbi:MAG: hypothetical protein GY723_20285 [bacterium]|nr:hypothetical protein [bacterium]MCP5066588.1 hypothetical protein [bacterium]